MTGRGSRTFYEDLTRSYATRGDEVLWQAGWVRALTADAAHTFRLLDVGCGPGHHLRQAAHGVDASVVGVDVAHKVLVEAAGHGIAAVQSELGAQPLPFASGSFDLVIAAQVIEHLVDTDGLVEEIHRVLRPGGRLLLTTPNLAAWFNRGMLLLGMQPLFTEVSTSEVFGRPGRQVVGHLRLFTKPAVEEFLRARGFTEVDVVGGTYHDIPRPLRLLDRVMRRRAGFAANLLVTGIRPVDEEP